MKKFRVITKPTKVADLSFDDLFDETNDWAYKAKHLQIRRWEAVKQKGVWPLRQFHRKRQSEHSGELLA